jgi:hypothetical protein
MRKIVRLFFVIAAGAISMSSVHSAVPIAPPVAIPAASYADLADLADSAPLVLRARLGKLARVESARAIAVRPGWGRFYVEAKTQALIAGNGIVAESLRYLVDLPLDAKGKPPALTKKLLLLFASAVPGRPGELRLVAPDAQVLWDAASEAKLRAILTELLAPDVPPRISGVREAIHVAGSLAGEGETQMFLAAGRDGAASISVLRRPGAAPVWGVTFSEVAEAGSAPPRETLRWYRLACFLPATLPPGVNLSEGAEARAIADADYQLVMRGLWACPRLRR